MALGEDCLLTVRSALINITGARQLIDTPYHDYRIYVVREGEIIVVSCVELCVVMTLRLLAFRRPLTTGFRKN